ALLLGGGEESTIRRTKAGMTSVAESITESLRRSRQMMVQEVERSASTLATFDLCTVSLHTMMIATSTILQNFEWQPSSTMLSNILSCIGFQRNMIKLLFVSFLELSFGDVTLILCIFSRSVVLQLLRKHLSQLFLLHHNEITRNYFLNHKIVGKRYRTNKQHKLTTILLLLTLINNNTTIVRHTRLGKIIWKDRASVDQCVNHLARK
ncbi:hypothetical protein ACJX0J_017401, partial [Zea mays]